MKDYWIHYPNKNMYHQIGKLGAYYVKENFWRIDNLKRNHSSYKILRALGLTLTEVINE